MPPRKISLKPRTSSLKVTEPTDNTKITIDETNVQSMKRQTEHYEELKKKYPKYANRSYQDLVLIDDIKRQQSQKATYLSPDTRTDEQRSINEEEFKRRNQAEQIHKNLEISDQTVGKVLNWSPFRGIYDGITGQILMENGYQNEGRNRQTSSIIRTPFDLVSLLYAGQNPISYSLGTLGAIGGDYVADYTDQKYGKDPMRRFVLQTIGASSGGITGQNMFQKYNTNDLQLFLKSPKTFQQLQQTLSNHDTRVFTDPQITSSLAKYQLDEMAPIGEYWYNRTYGSGVGKVPQSTSAKWRGEQTGLGQYLSYGTPWQEPLQGKTLLIFPQSTFMDRPIVNWYAKPGSENVQSIGRQYLNARYNPSASLRLPLKDPYNTIGIPTYEIYKLNQASKSSLVPEVVSSSKASNQTFIPQKEFENAFLNSEYDFIRWNPSNSLLPSHFERGKHFIPSSPNFNITLK